MSSWAEDLSLCRVNVSYHNHKALPVFQVRYRGACKLCWCCHRWLFVSVPLNTTGSEEGVGSWEGPPGVVAEQVVPSCHRMIKTSQKDALVSALSQDRVGFPEVKPACLHPMCWQTFLLVLMLWGAGFLTELKMKTMEMCSFGTGGHSLDPYVSFPTSDILWCYGVWRWPRWKL